MTNIRFLTSGESHGIALAGIIEGIPSGLSLSSEDIDRQLKRRQGGYGRGGRMKIETDHARILSGVRAGKTIGSPISLLIENKDWENWQDVMGPEPAVKGPSARDKRHEPVTRPRPGHADLAGAMKFDHRDIRNVLERSSARETAMRVGLGAIAKKFLSEFGIMIGSHVIQIGSHRASFVCGTDATDLVEIFEKAEKSPVRCADQDVSKKMMRLIDRAIKQGDSLGGVFEVFAAGAPVGLGSHIQWDLKLDGLLSQAIMSIQAMKGVEIGLGFKMAGDFGSHAMDEIFYDRAETRSRSMKFYRKTNNAGGIEGGMSNGMPVIIRAAMKPIPTLRRPLMSVDIRTKKAFEAAYERSDVCAVPAAAVVAEAMTSLVLADAFLRKFGGDSVKEVKRNYKSYISYVNGF